MRARCAEVLEVSGQSVGATVRFTGESQKGFAVFGGTECIDRYDQRVEVPADDENMAVLAFNGLDLCPRFGS
jgi:hypothetical protein